MSQAVCVILLDTHTVFHITSYYSRSSTIFCLSIHQSVHYDIITFFSAVIELNFFSEDSYDQCASKYTLFYLSFCWLSFRKTLFSKGFMSFAYSLFVFFVLTSEHIIYNSFCLFVLFIIFLCLGTCGCCHPCFYCYLVNPIEQALNKISNYDCLKSVIFYIFDHNIKWRCLHWFYGIHHIKAYSLIYKVFSIHISFPWNRKIF